MPADQLSSSSSSLDGALAQPAAIKPLKTALMIIRILAGLTLVLIALGSYVRATGAGLSCPDWPLCYGRVIPPTFESGVAQEVTHRVVASAVAIGYLAFLFFAAKIRREQPKLFKAALFIGVLLAVQIVFGGLTVLMKLNPFVVTAHLFLGTILFQTLAQLSLERSSPRSSSRPQFPPCSAGVRAACWFTAALVVAQILVGGFVGSSGASLACPDAPLCFGQLIPKNAPPPVHLQVGHRLLGGVLLAALFFLAFNFGPRRSMKMHAFGMVFLVGVQIMIGIANVNFGIPVLVTIIHLVVAQLILLGVIVLVRRASALPSIVKLDSAVSS